jgi:CRISPR-associated protein Csd1
MILQALNEHYWRLVKEPDSGVALPGYSPAKVTHVIVLDKSGDPVDVWSISEVKGKKSAPRILLVPEQVTRTSGISANILCDKSSYILGIELSKQDEVVISQEKISDFQEKNLSFLTGVMSEEAAALKRFLEKWTPQQSFTNPIFASRLKEIVAGSNLVFKLDGAEGYLHEDPELQQKWDQQCAEQTDDAMAQCLVTGEQAAIARIHPAIKGVLGAQTSGAAMVSYNADAFTSYGKSQSFNAPVSQKAAFAYATALNYLIASHTNRVRVADTTMVFWADKKSSRLEESILAWSLDPVSTEADDGDESRGIDQATAMQAKTVLEQVKAGLPPGDAEIDPETTCYLLGLAPNAARLSVRFWEINSFGALLGRIVRHYQDLEIIGVERVGGYISPWRILRALAVQEDSKNIPPLLGGQLMKSILTGQLYPQMLFTLALNRCRTGGDHGGVNMIRASVIKAFITRKARLQGDVQGEELVSVSLNENNPSGAYQLGRLFSLLEKAQKDALGGQINATIRDRYFGAASATPGAVFPLLMRLSRHHVAKSDYGANMDRKIQDVVNRLDAFPAHLNLEEQGQFILGYYHQNQANYQKNDNSTKETNEVKEG